MRLAPIAIVALTVLCWPFACLALCFQSGLLSPTIMALRTVPLSQLEQAVNIARSVATTLALFVGGVWSYLLFVRTRQKYPRAALAHDITHRDIGHGAVLLHVDVTVANRGDVLVSLVESETRVQQVLPLPQTVSDKILAGEDPVNEGDSEVEWDELGSHKLDMKKRPWEIEPGDTQEINHDFILAADIRTVEVYSYVVNETKRPRKLAWDLTTLYDFPAPQ